MYQCDNLGRLNWSTKIDCKNRRGKFSLGRKVSGINFVNQTDVIITTNDSRLRLFNLDECLQKVKFKGFKGENLQFKASLNKNGTRIAMGSEDGNIFLWDIEKTGSNHYKDPKQKAYEVFNPFLVSKLDQEQHLKSSNAKQLEPTVIVENADDSEIESEPKQYLQNRQNICNIAMFVRKTVVTMLQNQQ